MENECELIGEEDVNLEIGEEMPPVEPETCVVLGVFKKKVVFDEGEKKKENSKVILRLEHSAVGQVEISKVKYQKGDKLPESGLWLTKDKDGKLPYSSALAHLLRHYKLSTLKDLIGKKVDTLLDANGYLIIKAY